ncbi:MAG: hypothetical protein ACK5LR_04415 [Mangrovibacterium sp.]
MSCDAHKLQALSKLAEFASFDNGLVFRTYLNEQNQTLTRYKTRFSIQAQINTQALSKLAEFASFDNVLIFVL